MSTDKNVRIEKKEWIGIITFGLPGSLNVLDSPTLVALRDALTDLEKEEGTRVIVLKGDRHFSAGANIRELKGKDAESAQVFAELGHSVCDRIENMQKPVIAAVNGYALGAGLELALACDMRIASEGTKFGQPEAGLGLIPGFGGTQRLTRLAGIGISKELILTGRIIDAREALSFGIVNTVVKDGELFEKAEDIARLMAQKSPVAIKLAKRLINENHRIGGELEMEIAFFADCFAAEDHTEGLNAFLEKRQPKFNGN